MAIDDQETAALTAAWADFMEDGRPERQQPMLLGSGLARTYAELVLGYSPSAGQAAVMAALMAKNRGSYLYWSSTGQVHSSHDVFMYMQREQSLGGVVISATEEYTISWNSGTRFDNLEDIPLEYAVAVKKYEALGRNNALKAALVHVCSLWGIKLECSRVLDDVEHVYEPAVYPLPLSDSWIIDKIAELSSGDEDVH